MRVVERIGPLVPAIATVGASVCVTSLLLTTVPHALGPPPRVPPLKSAARPASVSVSPLTHLVSHSRVARSPEHRSSAGPARASNKLTPPSRPVSTQVSQGASPPPPAPPSPPSLPTPPAAPSVTPPASVTVAPATPDKPKRPKDTTRPGWGHGDPNHDHTGPPGKASKGQKDQTTPPQAAPPATPATEHGSPQGGGKKSEGG